MSSGKKFSSSFLKVSSFIHSRNQFAVWERLYWLSGNFLFSAHADANLDPILQKFDLLGNCVKDINGDKARSIENKVLEEPDDVPAQNALLKLTADMATRCTKC